VQALPPLEVTVSVTLVVAVVLPEVPVIVTVDVPTVAVLLAVKVTTLLPAVGLVAKEAVTPLGSPDAASVTLPAKPPVSVTAIVSVAVPPSAADTVDAEGVSVKPAAVLALTVREIVVLADRLPEVPVIVTVDVATVAVLLAVKVTTLLPVVGLVPKAAVTPLGSPEAARVTLPLNPPLPATVTVSVALLPCVTDSVDAERDSVKLGDTVDVPDTKVVMLCTGSV
jgi:hypothetical protein